MDAAVLAPPRYGLVVAADADRGIGQGNDLPWPRLPGDLAHFKRITAGTRDPARQNAVVMGRRTWDSLPPFYRPMPGRINIVVSRASTELPGAHAVAPSLAAAIDAAVAAGGESIYCVGGGQLFALAMDDPRCALVYYTRIEARFPHDTVFPAFEDRFVLDAEDPPRTDGGVRYTIQRWRRRDMIAA
jgi:dihydrofolate reductase